MTEFKIEKDVPLPLRTGTTGPPRKYPFEEMDVGDSFFIPDRKTHSASGSVTAAQHRTGFGFTCRAENGGVRVWRIR